MAAVVMIIPRIGVAIDRIDAEAVIGEAVAIVIDAIMGAIGLVPKYVRGEVRVRRVDPGIDHRHHDLTAPGGEAPGLGGVNVRTRGAALLAGVPQAPQLTRPGVIRHSQGLDEMVRLRIADHGVLPEEGQRV
jgi:hypothetical protein